MRNIILNLVLFLFIYKSDAQKIIFNKSTLFLNENLDISVAYNKEKIKNISRFPDIIGFAKIDSSLSISSYTVTYKPTSIGTFSVKPFKIKLNNKTVSSQGATLIVKNNSDFNDFFKNSDNSKPTNSPIKYIKEILNVKQLKDEFIVISASSNDVYMHEGVKISASLYILEKKIKNVDFNDFENNYNEIIKLLKHSNCLEQNIPQKEIKETHVIIKKNKYMKFNLYNSFFFPFKNIDIQFKRINLPLLKYKKNNSEIWVASEPIKIKTKSLPTETNNVGKFELKETISKGKLKPGESTKYIFEISGIGNINNLSKPIINNKNNKLEIYDLGSTKFINNDSTQISGKIKYTFQITSKTNEKVLLNQMIFWPYFNLRTQQMDTLFPRISITSTGESIQNALIESNQSDSFYELINNQNTKLRRIDSKDEFKKWANIGFIIMLSLTLFYIFKKSKKTH